MFDLRYSDARMYAPLLVASVIFSTLSLFYGGIQISLKRPKQNGFSTIAGAVVNLVVHFALIKYIGLYAAAVSTLVSNLVVMAIRVIQLKNDFYFKVEKKHVVLLLIFVYYLFVASMKVNLILGFVNVIIASIIFVFSNKEFIVKILRKLRLVK